MKQNIFFVKIEKEKKSFKWKRCANSKNDGVNSEKVVKKNKRLRLDRCEPSDRSEGSDLIPVKFITAIKTRSSGQKRWNTAE